MPMENQTPDGSKASLARPSSGCYVFLILPNLVVRLGKMGFFGGYNWY